MKKIFGLCNLSLALTGLLFVTAPSIAQEADVDDAAHLKKGDNSAAFTSSAKSAVEKLRERGFTKNLQTAALGAMSDTQITALAAEIKKNRTIDGIRTGKGGESYDVILQPGHYGRTSGKTGATGKLVSEQDLMSHLVKNIAKNLSGSGLKVLVVPADQVVSGMKTKVFLAVHADGSEHECTTGPSLGYAGSSSTLAMHAVGESLARAYGYKYEDFRKDNFTANEAHYYMFGKVTAARLNGLLEVGEITCEKSEKRLLQNSVKVAANIASAVQFIANLQEGD